MLLQVLSDFISIFFGTRVPMYLLKSVLFDNIISPLLKFMHYLELLMEILCIGALYYLWICFKVIKQALQTIVHKIGILGLTHLRISGLDHSLVVGMK